VIEREDMNESAQELLDDECAEFQALMSARIGAGEDLQSYKHMQSCERCRALVRDLESIAIAARELMGLDEEPEKDLWSEIAEKIKLEETNGHHATYENSGEDPQSPAPR